MTKQKQDEEDLNTKLKLYKSITAISQTLLYLKYTLEKSIEISQKHNTDITLTNQKLDFYKDDMNEIKECVRAIEKTLSSLNIQLDFKEKEDRQEKKNLQKEIENNKKIPFWDHLVDSFTLFMTNSKWIAIILLIFVVILAINSNFISTTDIFSWIKTNFHIN
jgi:pantothenate kinase-related protein Tda10